MNYELITKKLYVILDEKYITKSLRVQEFKSSRVQCSRVQDGTKNLESIVTALCEGGADIIQLREKNKSSKEFLEDALIIKNTIQKFKSLRVQEFKSSRVQCSGITFIVNDKPDIALLSGADGVHLGESDIPIKSARKLLTTYVIGASVSSVQSAIKACEDGADYVAVGCLFPSNTKTKALVPLTLISDIKKAVNVPVFGIGGITIDKIESVLNAGADGVAIAGDIFNYPDIRRRTEEIRLEIRD